MDRDEVYFPPEKLRKLEEKITNSNEVVPIFPKEELQCLLNATIDLCRNGTDVQNEACQRFFREGLTLSFTKILTDDAITYWRPRAHRCIFANCENLVELCVYKLDDDSLPLLDLLAMVFDPNNKFHTLNAAAQPESLPLVIISDENVYAHPSADPEKPRGWLVDLINRFGDLGGFAVLFARFQRGRRNLTIPIIRALLRPFGLCHELLTVPTIEKYLKPVVERVHEILNNLTDEELEKEAQNQSISNDISIIMKAMVSLASRMSQPVEIIQILQSSRLKITLRLLKIVENTHEILSNLIFKLTVRELDQFIQCFQTSWKTENDKRREKLVEFIRQLAENDKNCVIVEKALTLFWKLAHSDDESLETVDQALSAHLKILNFSSSQDYKTVWLDKCFEELTSGSNWILPAMKQIRQIYNLYETKPDSQRRHLVYYRKDVIERLHKLGVVSSVIDSLETYLEKVRQFVKENPVADETTFMLDGRYNHVMQVQQRLDFLRFVLDESCWWLDIDEANQIWQCLAERAVFASDREACYQWFSQLVGEEPDLDPNIIAHFFPRRILKLDPTLLTESGFTCFERFFRAVNTDEGKLKTSDLVGTDYLWRVVTNCPKEIASRARELLQEFHADLRSQLQLSVSAFHKTLIVKCTDQLEAYWNLLSSDGGAANVENAEKNEKSSKIAMETLKMRQVTKVLQEFISNCNWKDVKNHSTT